MHPLKIARVRAGLTLGELSRRSGLRVMTISEIERGIHRPQAVTAHKLGKALGVDPATLLVEDEDKVAAS